MKEILSVIFVIALLITLSFGFAGAQMMGRNYQVYSANQSASSTDQQYETLGEQYMKQMMGNQYDYMSNFMSQRLGDQGLSQMEALMGKMLSGYNSSSQPYSNMGQMMNGLGPYTSGNWGGYSMMGWGNTGWSWLAWPLIIFWLLIGLVFAVGLPVLIVLFIIWLFIKIARSLKKVSK